jgi:carboxyl-terminal processing protease
VVLREGEKQLRTVELAPADETAPPLSPDALRDGPEVARLPYGDADALLVTIHDVRDDLGDQLARTLSRERARRERPLAGVVLDLRGNGGGSTDGAIEAVGLFLPGVRLYPMKRRDGTIETDRAPEPPRGERWTGPVATIIDATTASAAEMIAGALAVYRRGPSVGVTTYGKGCAQEYLDDDAHAGVLRLTTLLFALPDGSPVQRVGLTPTIHLPFAVKSGDEREADLPHAPPTWRGPDVRNPDSLGAVAWPAHGGSVGPCTDPEVCRVLRALGGSAKRVGSLKK